MAQGKNDLAFARVCQALKSIETSVASGGRWDLAWIYTGVRDPRPRYLDKGIAHPCEFAASVAYLKEMRSVRDALFAPHGTGGGGGGGGHGGARSSGRAPDRGGAAASSAAAASGDTVGAAANRDGGGTGRGADARGGRRNRAGGYAAGGSAGAPAPAAGK
jgi:hypothetical protein